MADLAVVPNATSVARQDTLLAIAPQPVDMVVGAATAVVKEAMAEATKAVDVEARLATPAVDLDTCLVIARRDKSATTVSCPDLPARRAC